MSRPDLTERDVLPFLGRRSYIEDGVVVTPAGTTWPFGAYVARRRYVSKPEVKARRAEEHRRWVEANRRRPCLGDRCLTMTPGGRVCHFCRRTAELA